MKEKGRNRQSGRSADKHAARPDGPVWLWGIHAVEAAINNPARKALKLVATKNAAQRLGTSTAEIMEGKALSALLPKGAVHQGLAMRTEPLKPVTLADVIGASPARVAVLDQVEDPHNLGAIFRSAAAFGVSALILQTRHAPLVTGIVAKSAAGAIERVSECRVVNIARSLDALADAGYVSVGLAGEGRQTLAEMVANEPRLALVLGAEGAGLRPAVAKACTCIARIPIQAEMESLNVSNAAAIAFYEASRGVFSPD
ncbi:MAG: RNA methyltransferase [Hyphomonadaceae bacterium]